MKKRLLSAVICAAILFSMTACAGKGEESGGTGADTEITKSGFSDFVGYTLGAEPNEIDETIFKDNDLTLINVWATYCSPCLDEMPDLAELHTSYGEGFGIVGICADTVGQDGYYDLDQIALAQKILKDSGVEYPNLLPSNDLLAAELGQVAVVPTSFFVDSKGDLVGKAIQGARSKKDWIKLIDERMEIIKEAK